MTNATITRIAVTVPGNTIIYNVFQNAARSYNSGIEVVVSSDVKKWLSVNFNATSYYNQIDAFTVINKYPQVDTISVDGQSLISGNAKLNAVFHFKKDLDVQLTSIYLAPDIVPQGKIGARFSLDLGIQKTIQKGKGTVFLNATDLLNTMVIRQEVQGQGFYFTSNNYHETQVVRIGYKYRF